MTEVIIVDAGCDDIAGKIASGIDESGGYNGDILIRSIHSLKEITQKKTDVLVLTEHTVKTRREDTPWEPGMRISCGILLLPGDIITGDGDDEVDIFDAECIVTYGMSPKNTITLSSISEGICVLALQRELITTKGDVLERQEIKINGGMRPDCLLAVAGALLILGQRPTDTIQ